MTVNLPPLNEAEYSQTLAALDERAKRLNRKIEEARTEPVVDSARLSHLDYMIDALHWTNMARLRLAEADEWQQIPPSEQTWTGAA